MQTITKELLSIDEANQALNSNLNPAMWEFIVRVINYPELRFNKESQCIHIDGYVPFRELAQEWIDGINKGSYDVRACEKCTAYFDVNTTDGIYGKPDDFEEFICIPCAKQMSALDYYQHYIERQR